MPAIAVSYTHLFLLSLINDVLDVAKIESGKMSLASEPFDFDELVSSVSSFTYGSAVAKGIISVSYTHLLCPMGRPFLGSPFS